MGIFVGREREMELLHESVADAIAGGGPLVLLSGEPGIGKTRLAEELTRYAQSRDFSVTWGRAWEGEGTPAYFPWRQVLRRLAPSFKATFDATRAECPEIDVLLDARRTTSGDPTEARFRMFDAIAETLRLASAEKPLAIVFDDLHAADVSTLDLLAFVARSLRHGARVLLVGTMRDAQSSSPPLLAKIVREATALPLARLPREAVASWVAHSAPELAPSVDRLISVSEGNPLFVGELLASAKKQPGHRWSSTHELPLGVREAIRAHIATLSERTQGVLARASVLGREFPRAALREAATAEIDEAIHAGVLISAGDAGDDQLRFTHVLIRDELYAALPHDQRDALHREAATNEREPLLAAQHWLHGGRREDATAVLATVIDAMDDAMARFAFEDAATIGERALEKATFSAGDACKLHIAVGEAWTLAGKLPAARAHGKQAADEAQQVGDSELLARAALVHATAIPVGGRDEAAVALLRVALSSLPETDSSIRARVMGRLAVALLPAPPEEHAAALDLAKTAIAMARRLGDEEALFSVLLFTRETPSETETAETRSAINAETLALAKKLGRVPQVASLFSWQVAAFIELGDVDAALREVETMEALLPSGLPAYRFRTLLTRAMLADIEGRFAEADELSRESIRLCEESAFIPGLTLGVVQRTAFLYTRVDAEGWDEFEPMAARLLDTTPLYAIYRCTYDAPRGRVENVRASLDLTKDIPLETLPDAGGLAGPCAIAGIVEHAQRFYDFSLADEARKGPWQFGPGRITSMGPRALTLGRLAMLLGRKDDALRHFERALALVERLRSRPYIAQTRLELATALDSREHAEVALAIAREIGMHTVAARARAIVERSKSTTNKAEQKQLVIERDGETWRLSRGERRVVLKDAKGLAYLEALVAAPCREIHVLELAGQHPEGDAGPMLDDRAKREYRERADSLREELAEATTNADLGRVERLRSELDALARELARAVGIGNRDRRAVSPSERARINVQRRLRDVVGRVRTLDAQLGDYLQLSVRTGMFCIYLPVDGR